MLYLCPLVKPEKGSGTEELRELNPPAALSRPCTPIRHAGPGPYSAARPRQDRQAASYPRGPEGPSRCPVDARPGDRRPVPRPHPQPQRPCPLPLELAWGWGADSLCLIQAFLPFHFPFF